LVGNLAAKTGLQLTASSGWEDSNSGGTSRPISSRMLLGCFSRPENPLSHSENVGFQFVSLRHCPDRFEFSGALCPTTSPVWGLVVTRTSLDLVRVSPREFAGSMPSVEQHLTSVYLSSRVLIGSQSGPGGLCISRFARSMNTADGGSASATRASQFMAPSKSRSGIRSRRFLRGKHRPSSSRSCRHEAKAFPLCGRNPQD
jgi:hypothetical protein